MKGTKSGLIAAVAPGSRAERVGLTPGDCLYSINGHPLRDVIDYRFYSAEESLTLAVARKGQLRRLSLRKAAEEDLGLFFAEPLFDGVRHCRNACFFCFVDGLPLGRRPSLYIKDDDFRLSFLFGNFVTLTNLTEADWQRLGEQRLSPLRLSLHTTNSELRGRLLGNPKAPDILEQLRRLASLKIQVHVQIVLCPGVNDGSRLDETLTSLAAFYPTVGSIGVVPAGATQYHPQRSLLLGEPQTRRAKAEALLAQVRRWQQECRHRLGAGLVYAADEFYLTTGEDFPPPIDYDGFPQYENGIGLVPSLLEDWHLERAKFSLKRNPSLGSVTVVCGYLLGPVLSPLLKDLEGLLPGGARLVTVANDFFGSSVTVSGLLTGQDILRSLSGDRLGELVVLPRSALNEAGDRFLDDMTVQSLEKTLGVPVAVIATPRELFSLLFSSPKQTDLEPPPAVVKGTRRCVASLAT